jgi:hypothetical protein
MDFSTSDGLQVLLATLAQFRRPHAMRALESP